MTKEEFNNVTSGVINQIKGNINDKEFEGMSIDYVDIHWYDSGKRIQRLVTNNGTTIGIRLDRDSMERGLFQGDVLTVKDGVAIVVNIIEEDCIVVKVTDLKTTAKVCYEIGNRHSPLYYSEDESEFIMPYDKPILEMLERLGVEISVKPMKIHRDKSISSVNTSHQDSHEH